METFDFLKWAKTIFWIMLAGAFGIVSQMQAVGGVDGFQLSDIDWTAAGMGLFLWGAIRSSIGWANASRPDWAPFKKLLSLAVIVALGASLAACGTLRPALGDHSGTEVTFRENTAAGDDTEIRIKATGEAAQTAGVRYTGQTLGPDETPWSLDVSGNQQVTSPQAQVLAQGIASAIEQTPGTLSDLAGQLSGLVALPGLGGGDMPGAPSIVRPIIQSILEGFFQRIGLPVP